MSGLLLPLLLGYAIAKVVRALYPASGDGASPQYAPIAWGPDLYAAVVIAFSLVLIWAA